MMQTVITDIVKIKNIFLKPFIYIYYYIFWVISVVNILKSKIRIAGSRRWWRWCWLTTLCGNDSTHVNAFLQQGPCSYSHHSYDRFYRKKMDRSFFSLTRSSFIWCEILLLVIYLQIGPFWEVSIITLSST